MAYYPVDDSHVQVPITITHQFSQAPTPASYVAFDDLTTLTEGLGIEHKAKKIPSEDDIGTVSFYYQNSIPLPAVGLGYSTVSSFSVPIGYDGVLKKIQNNLTGGGFVNGSGDVIWQIIADDVPIKNYDSILTERGDPNNPTQVSSIRIYSGQVISYVVNHVTNPTLAGYTVAGLVGYFYPKV